MKQLLTFLLIVTLILSGCTHNRPAAESEPTILPDSTEAMASTAVTEAEETIPEETESFSQPVTEPAPTTAAADIQFDRTSTEEKYKNTEPVDKENEPPEIHPKKEEPKETAPPATTEPAEESENTSPTEPPSQATSPPEEETTVPSQPVEETQPEPEFEIGYWISFAKTYAQSIGLNLDAAAVDCWDNPITAGAHCIYLERDITNRLNRYNADEDITDVWIWAVDLGNGTYDLYIGYVCILEYANVAIGAIPESLDAYYWLIYAMNHLGMGEIARNELKAAKQTLTENDYQDLLRKLGVNE